MVSKQAWERLTSSEIEQFQEDFLLWYEKEKRNLPWRADLNPYRIWISEIMLQQTRVDTVIGYFYRFMECFPTIESLAQAPEDVLLKTWEGLGYYSRARNLKTAAQQIMDEFAGQMPQTIAELRTLKGIGPYTAGAIGSIAFQIKAPAVDGNVMRVVSRLFEIKADIAKASSRKLFELAMETIISPERPGDFNQAMMDLGSAICTPTSPKCKECPIQKYCKSREKNTVLIFPVKSKKVKPKDVYYMGYVVENNQKEMIIEQREAQGLLANLWLFPMQEVSKEEYVSMKHEAQRNKSISPIEPVSLVAEAMWDNHEQFSDVVWQKGMLGEVDHLFSHLKWHTLVFYGRATKRQTLKERQRWVKQETFPEFVFPKPQQKMVSLYTTEQ